MPSLPDPNAVLLNLFPCPDLDHNGRVEAQDLSLLLAHYPTTSGATFETGDIDGDGDVDAQDLALLLASYPQTCPQAGSVDLDVDSDNTNATSVPDRSATEDADEDNPALPGKFVLVNDDDDDFNGTPDKDQVGSIAAEQDDLTPIVIEIVPAGQQTSVNYRLIHPANLRVWRFSTRGSLGADVVAPGATQSYTVSGGSVTFWVEGLTPSAAGGDVRILAEADTNADGSFESSDAVRLSLVRMSTFPQSGILGATVTTLVEPVVAPLSFDSATSGTWSGAVPDSITGSDLPFSIAYSSAHVHEGVGNVADIVLGDGQLSGPAPSAPPLEGTLNGRLGFDFGSITLQRAMLFEIQPSYLFVGGAGGAGDPVADIPFVDPTHSVFAGGTLTLESAVRCHLLFTLLADKTSLSASLAPTGLQAYLVSLDSAGAEMDRVSITAYLEQERSDFGSTRLVYYSDWHRPILLVTSSVNPSEHPTLTVLRADPEGRIVPVLRP